MARTSCAAPAQSLDAAIKSLQHDLLPIINNFPDEGAILVYRGAMDHIVVCAPATCKAYLPKKYSGWDIHFVDSAGTVTIDMDQLIIL